jgi:hypothetical protein
MFEALSGGNVPFVLRPLPGPQPNTFELVGDCYVHGVMNGEAVTESFWNNVVRPRSKSLDPDLPLHNFYDVFIV